MYFYLVGALKNRLILELRDSFSRHPVYRKIVPYIQNRFSFEDRPEFGIVVKGSNANKVQLDASNFIGHVQSHVMLARVEGREVFPLEWVREDLRCVKEHGMQTASGVYYLEILTAPGNAGEVGTFVLDPLLTVTDEPVALLMSGLETEGQLQSVPLAGTLRLYEDRTIPLTLGEDYTLGDNGAILFTHTYPPGTNITADYRYPTTSIGPIPFKWNSSDTKTLPGVVLAFGKRAEPGQKVAVVVYSERVDAAQAYGGKNEVSFDLEILARDPTQSEEIADLTNMFLWADKKPVLEFEGIEILDVSIGGEAEDPIDETGDNYQYSVSMSVQIRADWEMHLPLPLVISRMETEDIQQVSSGMFHTTFPVFANRNSDFERIG